MLIDALLSHHCNLDFKTVNASLLSVFNLIQHGTISKNLRKGFPTRFFINSVFSKIIFRRFISSVCRVAWVRTI